MVEAIVVRIKGSGRVDCHSAFGACFHPRAVFQARANPMKSPSCWRDIDWFTVERWPSLISNQPRLRYTVNAMRVLHGERCRLTHFIHHLTFASAVSPTLPSLPRTFAKFLLYNPVSRWYKIARRFSFRKMKSTGQSLRKYLIGSLKVARENKNSEKLKSYRV